MAVRDCMLVLCSDYFAGKSETLSTDRKELAAITIG